MKKLTLIALAFLALNLNAQQPQITGNLTYYSNGDSAVFNCTSGCGTPFVYQIIKTVNGKDTTISDSSTSYPLTILSAGGIKILRIKNLTITNPQVAWSAPHGLPVELIYFKGKDNQLLWSTASEAQNKGWNIERSTDAINWTTIGFVQGGNNSDVTLEYKFQLKEFGKYYYRIKQLDIDGHFEYSEIEYLDNSNLIDLTNIVFIDLNGNIIKTPVKNTIYILPNKTKVIFLD
jgi:hypothetical protein